MMQNTLDELRTGRNMYLIWVRPQKVFVVPLRNAVELVLVAGLQSIRHDFR